MELLISILIGALFAGGIFCLLRRSLMKLVIGIILLSQGANLLLFTAGGLTTGRPAFVDSATGIAHPLHADPIPQALVLTAIVIGFGLVAFTLALLLKAYRALGSDDINTFNQTDRIS
ncbi:MAG: multicomponent Na+:H+ antiporter subunit C [Lentimonas sp.]|jgi:multicomponent Na+:H+ antiporter subunit C